MFCFDGSDDSRAALRAAADLLEAGAPALVLTVWQTAADRLARSGGFGLAVADESSFDEQELKLATTASDEAAAAGRQRGYEAGSRVERAREGVAPTIISVAEEIDARLIVCGRRGRGSIASAFLGSVSRDVLAHTRRPVLIVPDEQQR